MAVHRADPSGDRGRPRTNPAIPSLALLTALAAPATPVASPSARGGGRGDLAADPPQEHPNPFSVEWQLPLPTRDLIVQQGNRDVVVDVRDTTRGDAADLELFVAASHSVWKRGGHLTLSGGLSDATKEGVGGAGAA
jgi:hypothetical protein